MLKLLKTEFLYSKYLKISIGPLIGLIIYYTFFVQLERIYAMIAVLFFILIMSVYGSWKIEKRVRKLSILPVSPKEIAKARILIFLLPLITMYLILSFITPTSIYVHVWEKSYAELLFLFGLSLIGGSITFVMNDILSDFKWNEKIIFNILVSILAIALIIMLSMICVNSFKSSLIMGYSVIFLMSTAALLFLRATIKTFTRRSSYLE
jgi:hypothetical protein